ncbi:uncharacterized protein BO72DRAFT_97339 [Aspergillus fijiensis CBS 313.89]|uniref:NWD NACHT-NTPase N-terminal domain-containing protein n=1 Tax=Aspergillus fijiensis CBS 313.89 TaxID=1448319 RepID=A0A8G1RUN4_9EURO|nr:uncharacterized protein BO72DRAFT_97339 [Aspergillus fijiensis CBS 313.89]RAK77846.1 hypothetical protein BO72DRAFT_97339 [Aspergillus fijiensis CBS 313.89]
MDARKSKCNDADIASESTCWQEASARLRTEHPQLHAQFEGPSGADLSGQIAQSIMDSQNRTVEKDPPAAGTHRAAHEKARVRRRAMDTILRAVTVFRDVGSAVANLDPSHVGIAWAGVNLILQLVLSGAEQNAAALQGLAHISPIITRYAKVEEIYMEQRRKHDAITFEKDFRAQVVKLYVGILVYQGTIIAHSKRHRIGEFDFPHRLFTRISTTSPRSWSGD